MYLVQYRQNPRSGRLLQLTKMNLTGLHDHHQSGCINESKIEQPRPKYYNTYFFFSIFVFLCVIKKERERESNREIDKVKEKKLRKICSNETEHV